MKTAYRAIVTLVGVVIVLGAAFGLVFTLFSAPTPLPTEKPRMQLTFSDGAAAKEATVWLVWATTDGEVHFYKLKKGTRITEP